MKRLVFLLILVSLVPAIAQVPRFVFGAVGGVRLSDVGLNDESRRYTVGPSIEAQFGDHLAVEFDALYKRLGSSSRFPGLGGGVVGVVVGPLSNPVPYELLYYAFRTRAHSWEFPVLGKYYFGGRSRASRLFVQTGYSFQRSWATTEFTFVERNVESGEIRLMDSKSSSASPLAVGAVFGGGITRKAGPLTLAPTFRYTRWGWGAGGLGRNQAEFLLGIRF